jgi:hypothetical protein
MKIALTEAFLEDLSGLQPGLQRKCREMLSSLRRIEARDLREQALPGWRLHKLLTSPFISLSLDMNYRVLGKIEGDTAYIHRAIKHDLADASRTNRNDTSASPYMLDGSEIGPSQIFEALLSLGVSPESARPFREVANEDDLIGALATVDEELATFALALYETSGLVIPRTKYSLLQSDKDLETALSKSQAEWDIYLHPSQRYIAALPIDYRLIVSGSAGTGKTVCAWYRLQHLAQRGHTVGFVCANNAILKVSQEKIGQLLRGNAVDCYYLVPSSRTDLIQLAEAVKHVIIDEGQEFAPGWYQSLGEAIRKQETGLTVFFDLNQLGGNIERGDTRRFEQRLSSWESSLRSIPNGNLMELYINYRNSREIAQFYHQLLEESLPHPIRSEIPVFASGEVVIHRTKDLSQLPTIIGGIINKLRIDFRDDEIGIICLDTTVNPETLCQGLNRLGVYATADLDLANSLLVTKPRIIRGHERKAIIVCTPSRENITRDWGRAIDSYVALSRARDRLIIIEMVGG